ncbi:putative ubiquinone biosynthesis monooxygenase [Coemansia sp. RSA 552]|nr:putative ubiquinone biosynthesis monooxygenase [Coemansia sp. RSA 552]
MAMLLSRSAATRAVGVGLALRSGRSRVSISTAQLSESPGSGPRAVEYDVVVVGAGPTGCALASVLGVLGLPGATNAAHTSPSVALVDSGKLDDIRQWEPPQDTYLPRTLQITASNKRYLDGLGLWSQCYEERTQAYDRAVVTDAQGGGSIDLAAARTELGTSAAYMIETKNLVGGLLRGLHRDSSGVDVYEKARVTDIGQSAGDIAAASAWPIVTLSDGRRLQARLLVGADGANSRVRRYAGIGTYGTDYKQYGLVATLCLEQLNCTAFQRFLPTGPIAALPFPGGFANLVWSLDADLVQLIKFAPEGIFAELVNAAFRLAPTELEYIYGLLRDGAEEATIRAEIEWRLDVFARNSTGSSARLPPRVAAVSPRSRTSFPLRMRMVDRLVADRVALVGDAGHVMHPLAGQGLNMGLEDVQCLAQVIGDAAAAGEDIGAAAVLDRYNRHRYVRNLAMQGIVDKVWRVFGARIGPAAALRTLVMDGLDRLPAAKSRLINAMMS